MTFHGPRTYVIADEHHRIAAERLEKIQKKVQTARVLRKIRRNTSGPPKRA